jgi:hypothetical protein
MKFRIVIVPRLGFVSGACRLKGGDESTGWERTAAISERFDFGKVFCPRAIGDSFRESESVTETSGAPTLVFSRRTGADGAD